MPQPDTVAVRSPFAGELTLQVRAGDRVAVGDPIGTVEAVKMEAAVRSPVAGRVRAAMTELHVRGGDPLVWVETTRAEPTPDRTD